MNHKTVIFISIIAIVVLGWMLFYERSSFPIEFKVCDINYSSCSIIAHFDDINSCEATKEKWSWYCDTLTDSAKPGCRVEKSQISTSICSER